jgi:S-DNA-T family DNA segregation ATPase FtsK/SpoIIIE
MIISISLLLLLFSFASLCTLLLYLCGNTGAAAVPGRFLMEAFSWAAFFIPLYFVLAILLLSARVFRRRSALLLTLSVIPFLTISLLLHVLDGSRLMLPQLLLSSFGTAPSVLLLVLLLSFEILFLLTFPFGLATAIEGRRSAIPSPRRQLQLPAIPDEIFSFRSGRPAGKTAIEEGSGPVGTGAVEVKEPAAEENITPVVESAEPSADLSVEGIDTEDDMAIETEAEVVEPAPEPEAESRASPETPVPDAPLQPELPFGPRAERKPAYGIPVEGVLKLRNGDAYWEIDDETRRAAGILIGALMEFGIQAEVTGIRKGPVITLFEVLPAPGVRVSKIANLSDNIALRLAAPSVRIVAPIPGKHAVGIEVPNKKRAIVSFREMISPAVEKSNHEIPVVLGKDILGDEQIIDLVQTPHLLIGGATNSGKSVLVNTIICSILFGKSPEDVRMFLIDPKIVELKSYNGVPHLLTPVITEPRKAFQALQYCIAEMERRYTLLDALAVRDIRSYNKKAKRERVSRLPYIVIVIDEFADLMATTGKELESTLARLAAMSRAVGIHMVLATQRPSIDVITGLIKANIPSRIAFMVANKFDSRIIIDCVGAEKLLGKGDMLFSAAWNPFPTRIQGAYVDEDETEAITDYVKKLGSPQYIDDEVFFDADEEQGRNYEGEPGGDPLFEKALEIIIAQGKASASYIQRRLKVGYNRAARLVEEMEMRGIVGPAQGSKPREVIHVPKGNL